MNARVNNVPRGTQAQQQFYKSCPKCGRDRPITRGYCKGCHAAYMRERVIEWAARAAFSVMIDRSIAAGVILDEKPIWDTEPEALRDDWRAAIKAALAVPRRSRVNI